MMDMNPPTISWRSTPRRRTVNGGVRDDVVYHAVRGRHTVCGRSVDALIWLPGDGETTPRCSWCTAVPADRVTAHDLVELGPTYRQINHWSREGWLSPDNPWCGSGQIMTYPAEQTILVATVWRLVDAGIVASKAFHAVRNGGELAPGIHVVIDVAASMTG